MSQHYETEFKKQIVSLHLGEGQTLRSLTEGIRGIQSLYICISNWVYQYREEVKITKKPNQNTTV